jgi:aspartate racemase
MDGKNPLVVGVLGGMGSYSTLHFFEKLLEAFPAEKEWERPRVVIDNNCVLPSRVRAILYGERRDELVEGMAASIDGLLAYDPHVVVMPCNTAHCFVDEIRALRGATDDKLLHMIDVVAERCAADGHADVFLLATEGTVATGIYEDRLARHGVRVKNPSDAELVRVRQFIEQVKRREPLDHQGFRALVGGIDASAVVLGCTELSSFYVEDLARPLVDPVRVLVERIAAMRVG